MNCYGCAHGCQASVTSVPSAPPASVNRLAILRFGCLLGMLCALVVSLHLKEASLLLTLFVILISFLILAPLERALRQFRGGQRGIRWIDRTVFPSTPIKVVSTAFHEKD